MTSLAHLVFKYCFNDCQLLPELIEVILSQIKRHNYQVLVTVCKSLNVIIKPYHHQFKLDNQTIIDLISDQEWDTIQRLFTTASLTYKFLATCARVGDIDSTVWALTNLPKNEVFEGAMFEGLVKGNQIAYLDWMCEAGYIGTNLDYRIKPSEHDWWIWCSVHNTDSRAWLMTFASYCNSLEVVKWCINHNYSFGITDELACGNGNTQILDLLDLIDKVRYRILFCHYAARNGRVNSLQWLRAKGYRWNSWTAVIACKEGHVNVVRYMIDCGFQLDQTVVKALIKYSSILGLETMLAVGYQFDSRLSLLVVNNCNPKLLRWICRKKLPLHPTLPTAIVNNGDVRLLHLLHINGAINTDCVNYIVESGARRLLSAVLKWGYELEPATVELAINNNNQRILNILREWGYIVVGSE